MEEKRLAAEQVSSHCCCSGRVFCPASLTALSAEVGNEILAIKGSWQLNGQTITLNPSGVDQRPRKNEGAVLEWLPFPPAEESNGT